MHQPDNTSPFRQWGSPPQTPGFSLILAVLVGLTSCSFADSSGNKLIGGDGTITVLEDGDE